MIEAVHNVYSDDEIDKCCAPNEYIIHFISSFNNLKITYIVIMEKVFYANEVCYTMIAVQSNY